jgi:hypothetical protein
MWRHRADPYAEQLIEECESFLAGGSVWLCEARREPVPVWAWMNVLAHGTESELRAAAQDRPPNDEGRQALAFVAGELVELIDTGVVELEAFQRDVLVPLELDVIACPATTQWRPGQLVSGLLGALPARSRQAH